MHALICKVNVTDGENVNKTCCLKVFRKGLMTPYNLEKTAYEYLRHASIDYYVPHFLRLWMSNCCRLGFRRNRGWLVLRDFDGMA